jgi:hypothetical protein
LLLEQSCKPKSLSSKERKLLNIPWRYTPREMMWWKDVNRAERVQLKHLQKGDQFRELNKYGKPVGPRWTVVFDMEDYKEKYGGWGMKYLPFCSMMFKKDGDDRLYSDGHCEERIVKPIRGAAMYIAATFSQSTGFNLLTGLL